METILLTTTILFIAYKIPTYLYLFQIKEYRFDRLRASLHDEGILNFFCNFHLKLPAKTIRNLGIAGLSLITLTIFALILSQFPVTLIVLSLILSPLIAFIIVSAGVLITTPPVKWYRKRVMKRAIEKVKSSSVVCIGITGSYGKTSVKEFLYALLSPHFPTAKTEKNMNTDVGIAISILKNLQPQTRFFIAEFGAYKRGEIEEEMKIIQPTHGILTGLGNQHVDLYGSRQNLIDEESFLLTQLPKQGKAYINNEIPQREEIIAKIKGEVVTYSLDKRTDIHATNITFENNRTRALIQYKNESFTIETNLLGRHNILNLLPCIACARDLGLAKEHIIETINRLQPLNGRLSLHEGREGTTILNDSYNANLEGFLAAIEVLESLPSKEKIIMTQGIVELGVEKRASYEKIIKRLEQSKIQLYTTDKEFGEIKSRGKTFIFNDVSAMTQNISSLLTPQTSLLIEGRFQPNVVANLLK